MNSYGTMKESLRRVTQYQDVICEWMPGYGDDYYRITIEEGSQTISDIFYVYNDGDLNRAINTLYKRAGNESD